VCIADIFASHCRERIAGKDYSFSSDIWGCGLSILAVAMGCYPFSKRVGKRSQKLNPHRRRGGGDSGKMKEDVGVELDHSGGYWHILQSISQRPSIKELLGNSHPFSSQFCNFLSMSLHRDKSSRATAVTLLSHSFLNDPSSHSRDVMGDKTQTKNGFERDALRQFVARCCTAQRNRLSEKSSTSSHILPSLKTSEMKSTSRPEEIHLDFVRVTLGPGRNFGNECDSGYEYVSYNVADTDNINSFFTMFTAYKDFTTANWMREKDEGLLGSPRSSRASESSCRLKVLQLLLDSTLCFELHGSSSLEILRECDDLIEFSPSFTPLFDRVVIRNLAEQLNVSVYIVVICLRDFVMQLLNAEELSNDNSINLRGGEGVSKAGIAVSNASSLISNDNVVVNGVCSQDDESLVKLGSATVGSANGVHHMKDEVHGDIHSDIDDSISLLKINDSSPKHENPSQKHVHGLIDSPPDSEDSIGEDFYEDDFDS